MSYMQCMMTFLLALHARNAARELASMHTLCILKTCHFDMAIKLYQLDTIRARRQLREMR